MTDRATLLGLAERCEKASGPDRELDADIVRAKAIPKIAENVHWSPIGTTRELRGRVFFNGWEDEWWPVPAYTASLDAALSLVPKGWRKMVDDLDRTPEAIVSTPDLTRSWDGRAATMPLALTAAALRALAQQEKTND